MELTRFKELADAYGADIARWPQDEQSCAADLIEHSPELAQQILNDARALDSVLSLAITEPVRSELADMIVQSARPVLRPIPRWAGMAAAIALICGLSAGWFGSIPNSQDGFTEDELLFVSAFDVLSNDETTSVLEEA